MNKFIDAPRARPAARTSRGFTFPELLAAMMLVAILVPVTVEAIQLSHRAGTVAERKREAAQIADRMLAELIVTGDWRDGAGSGEVDEHPLFRYAVESEGAPLDSLTLVTLRITFDVQGREHEVALSAFAPTSAGEDPTMETTEAASP